MCTIESSQRFGKEFSSAEKASAEFRTPLWEILATPLGCLSSKLPQQICSYITNVYLQHSAGYGQDSAGCIAVLPHMRILAHTRMGRPICVYSYGTPIRVWDNILSHMSIFICMFYFFIGLWILLVKIDLTVPINPL